MDFETIFTSPHHALLFEAADRAGLLEELKSYFALNNQFHEVVDSHVIDIETARDLKAWNIRSYGGPKVMILSFHTMTIPAQNALLKVLEEPHPHTRFILITSYTNALLPTVLSRLQVHTVSDLKKENSLVAEFLKTAPNNRMQLEGIEELLAKKDNEERKDREAVQYFLSGILSILIKKGVGATYTQEVAQYALYASDASSSSKMILEYLSLRLPRIV